MNFRPAFWPGVLLGALTAFFALFRKPVPASPSPPDPLLDFVSEAVIACDSFGQIIQANTAARALFGTDLAGCQRLCYPTGQPVPPGQLPLARRGFSPSSALYLLTEMSGHTSALEATTWPRSGGGAAVVFRDVTVHTDAETKDVRVLADTETLHTLSRRLGLALTAEEAAEAAVEAVLALGAVTACCFTFDIEHKQLTQAAARPDARLKHPRTQNAARPVTAAFDATHPLHWAVYVSKEPFDDGNTLALPLTAGNTALGHLEVPAASEASREALRMAASLTAATMAARRAADRAEAGAVREAALGEIARLLADAAPFDTVCDATAVHARRVLSADVCTVTLGGHLRGQNYQDALLRPERHTPKDPALQHEAAEAAMASGETVQQTQLPSPNFAAAVWRAFAGASGRHRVLAVPLTGKKPGALTLWATGDRSFSAEQVTFAETLAALLSACPATAKASRTKPRTLPGQAGAD